MKFRQIDYNIFYKVFECRIYKYMLFDQQIKWEIIIHCIACPVHEQSGQQHLGRPFRLPPYKRSIV